uniref:Uncharacterized protein n=1 Tax=Leptobrachium leishanense TaxID=445787 RepID=A0A8C5PI16_9ANUR
WGVPARLAIGLSALEPRVPPSQDPAEFGRCRCNGRLVNGLDPKSIPRFGVFPPGSICDKVDIIVTMKWGNKSVLIQTLKW